MNETERRLNVCIQDYKDLQARLRTVEAERDAQKVETRRYMGWYYEQVDLRRAAEARVEALEAASLLAASNLDWLIGFLGVGEPASVEYLELALTKAKAARAALAVSGNQP